MLQMWSIGFSIVSSWLMLSSSTFASDSNIVCYYINSNGYSLAPPENLDPSLCTHINYAFAEISDEGKLVYQNEKLDIELGLYNRVANLTSRNPDIKIILSIGGVAASLFSKVAADKEKRSNFVTSATDFLQTFNFHGIDIDWEKPTANDSANFVALLKDLRKGFDRSPYDWILTAAVYPNPDAGYDVPEMAKYLDFFNLMTYNYYGSWSAYTGQNSPLFEAAIESSYEKSHLNVAVSIKNWINAGAPPEKINVGLAFYGRSFTLVSEDEHGLHAPIIGAGKTPTPSYRQICTGYNNWTSVWDNEQKNPYKYLDNQWLGYDDERSIKKKVIYAMLQDVAGVMIWHIGGDDVNGDCGERQGLLKVINNAIKTRRATSTV